MSEENIKKIDETKNYFLEEIKENELMSKRNKKVCMTLYDFVLHEHLLLLLSTITGCVSIPTFASLVGIPIGIASSSVGLKMCTITAGIQ